jgi:hypothetical protein
MATKKGSIITAYARMWPREVFGTEGAKDKKIEKAELQWGIRSKVNAIPL